MTRLQNLNFKAAELLERLRFETDYKSQVSLMSDYIVVRKEILQLTK
jgi:hypothetical protein